MSKIEFGRTYRDCITRFQGIATGHSHYISGCSQVLLQPGVDKDGKLLEGHWFDEQRLEEVAVIGQITLDNGATPGRDVPAPKR
ncbi:hypothetical protein J2X65_003547 [Ancylobacter sp. 3268]|uniref:hypothetical protein n=1 Tax=Ancylobacter sp. 3268 TaxID=2817752 RepID=UPI00286089CB|nr:hypothetical protein [Ancylobacter sp. 3268]MDR6954179.1 hypothetical protein [Ancylobacter sp. 3268]